MANTCHNNYWEDHVRTTLHKQESERKKPRGSLTKCAREGPSKAKAGSSKRQAQGAQRPWELAAENSHLTACES